MAPFSLLHVHVPFLSLLLLTATTSAAARDTNAAATITPTNSSTTADEPPGRYICYLCSGRNPMMIAWCPMELDYCHLACFKPTNAAGFSPAPSPAPFSSLGRRGGVGADDYNNNDDCYVMKLYPDGSYVIVANVSCSQSAGCNLVCSDGSNKATVGAAEPERTPGVADLQRCGDQLIAPSAVPGMY